MGHSVLPPVGEGKRTTQTVSADSSAWRRTLTSGPWGRALQLGCGLLVAIVGSSWAILAAAHVNDRYRVDFVSGTWLALADYATHGTLYPPLHADGHYGGTRYMPLPALLDAAFAKPSGNLLSSAKLATYLVALGLFAIAFAVLRQVRCPRILSLLLLAAVMVTSTGLVGTLGLRNDALAVLFQLAALGLVLRRQTTLFVGLAGVLAALAIFSKVSAIWAGVAIAAWLFAYHRSRLALFLAAFGGSLVSLAVVFELVTAGRFLTNVVDFTFAGSRGVASPLTEGVQAVLTNLTLQADAVWVLFPLALVAIVTGVRSRAPTLLQLALVADAVVLTVVMASPGTDHNHLLDLCLLTALVVGEFAGGRTEAGRRDVMVLVAVLAVVWGVVSSYQRLMGPETVGALRQLVHGRSATNSALDPNPLAGFVQPNDRILSEDPTIPLFLGQRPVLLDSFIARRAFADHPEWANELARQIEAKQFDKIILVAGLAPGTGLFGKQFLGPTVNTAVLKNYRQRYVERDIYVYLPVGRGQKQQPTS